MKKLFTLLLAAVLLTNVYSQVPEKMSFQAVVRNSDNALVTNSNIGVQVSILQGSITGTVRYVERHFPTTNTNGLVSIEIGNGMLVSGNFTNIDWSTGPFFIITEIDFNGGSNYTISGTHQLISVPFALFAKTSETSADAVKITGDQTIDGTKIFSNDLIIRGITVGTGKSALSYCTAIGYQALSSNTT